MDYIKFKDTKYSKYLFVCSSAASGFFFKSIIENLKKSTNYVIADGIAQKIIKKLNKNNFILLNNLSLPENLDLVICGTGFQAKKEAQNIKLSNSSKN